MGIQKPDIQIPDTFKNERFGGQFIPLKKADHLETDQLSTIREHQKYYLK